MSLNSPTKVFNNPAVIPLGWFWALPSKDLGIGEKRELRIFGETLVLYRGTDGKARAIEAYCPHMGAHLKEGSVEGASLRCGFHGWKFGANGACADIPCRSSGATPSSIPPRRTFPIGERFGMIWIHSDPNGDHPLPSFPALEGKDVTVRVDRPEKRGCHPTLILGGGVDEEHFLFVHQGTTDATGPLRFEHERVSPSVIRYWNSAQIPKHTTKGRLLSAIYRGVLVYGVTYWYGSTALAELGPPSLPLYSIFAYRPTEQGTTEGLNIYVTPRRRGPLGWLVSQWALWMTRKILRKGGGEDARIQNSIRLRLSPHALGNPPFAAFVRYVEEQPTKPVVPVGGA